MSEKIDDNKIFSSDFLEKTKASFRELLKIIDTLKTELNAVLTVQKQMISSSDKKSTEGLKKRQKAITKVNQVSKEMLKLARDKKRLSAQLLTAESAEAKAVAATRIELARKKKAVKEEVLAEKGLVSEYQKQSKRLNDLRKRYKDLILIQGKETRATRKMRLEAQKLDKRLKKVDASVGQFQRSVGNYPKAFGRAGAALRSMGLAIGGLAIIRSITGIVRNFEQSQADLASVLADATIPELEALTKQARELGATTRFTAGEISGLQKELAKLGFSPTEIENMTEATLQLAAATGTDLARAAEVTGATLRGFGLGAENTQRIVDLMAKSFTASSLDMEKFSTSMSSVAPVANSAGISVERTTAMLGTLTDRGLDASTAGTGLRNVFLELSKRGITFEQAMTKINTATDKNAASLDLFGKRGAVVGTILSATGTDIFNLEQRLLDAGGAAEEMADKQLDTLNGSLKLLGSAWEGFILDLEEGTGVFGGLKDAIFFVAANLETLIKTVAAAGAAFLLYKSAVTIGTIALKAYKAITIGYTIVQALLTGSTKKAAAAMRLFNMVVKMNPIGLLITAITAAVAAIWLFNNATSQAVLEQEAFNKGLEKGQTAAAEYLKELKKVSAEKLRAISLDVTKGAITKEEGEVKTLEVLEDEKFKLDTKLIAAYDEVDDIKFELARRKKVFDDRLNNLIETKGSADYERPLVRRQFAKLKIQAAEDTAAAEAIKEELNKQSDALEDEIKGLKAKKVGEQAAADIAEADAEDAAAKKAAAKRKARYEKRQADLSAMLIRLQDLNDQAIKDNEAREKKQINRKFDREIAEINKRKNLTKTETDLIISLNKLRNKQLLEIEEDFQAKKRALIVEQLNLSAQIEAQAKRDTGGDSKRAELLEDEIKLQTQRLKLIDKQIDQGNDSDKQLLKRQRIYDGLVEINKELDSIIWGRLQTSQTERELSTFLAKNKIRENEKEIEVLQKKIELEGTSLELQNKIKELTLEISVSQQKIRDNVFDEEQEKLYEAQLRLQTEYNEKLINGTFETNKKIRKLMAKVDAETDPKKKAKLIKKLDKEKLKSKEEINKDILKAELELKKKLLALDVAALENKKALYKENSKEWLELQKQISDKEVELQNIDKQIDGLEVVAEKEKELWKQRLDAMKNFAEKAIEILDAKTDKEIENIDKELAASKDREKQLEELAAKGNLTAQQSVGAEIKRQAELERQKAQLEKKKYRRQLILEGLDLLSSKIDNGDKDAVTSTLNDMTRLLATLQFLPGFYKGTETTVEAALGKPNFGGKDGYLIRADGKEKILNPKLSSMTGNATTDEIVNGFLDNQIGVPDSSALIRPQIAQLNAPFQDSSQILKKFDSLENTIRSKPILSDLKFNELTKALVITVEQSGNLKRTHYKLKK
jgi:TP901 family phage tail tape measure protein